MLFQTEYLGSNQDFEVIWKRMRAFTETRTPKTVNQFWILEHPPVFTLGQASKPEHLLNPKLIPVIQTDRGGQVTYHGPGQIIIYCLINLKHIQKNIREFVSLTEQAVIDVLNKHYQLPAERRAHAPGVYIHQAKICSIGLRVKNFCTYHGLSFNYHMDLKPFEQINPCGIQNLKITQLADHIPQSQIHADTKQLFTQNIITSLKHCYAS